MFLRFPLFLLMLSFCFTTVAAPGGNGVVPQERWYDSYSANGKCYIDSGLGKGLGNVIVPTPIGGQTLAQVAKKLGPGPGRAGNPIYNDVQCGNGPSSTARNEAYDQCPGRVDQGASGCSVIGPKWDLAGAYSLNSSSASAAQTPVTKGECDVTGFTLKQARASYTRDCGTQKRLDCDRIYLDDKLVWMCASYIIGKASPTGKETTANSVTIEPASQDIQTTATVTTQQPVEIELTDSAEEVAAPSELASESVTRLVGDCDAVGSDLINAKNAYANKCAAPRVDCDPTGNGKEYRCASYRMPRGASAVTPTMAAATPEVTVVELALTETAVPESNNESAAATVVEATADTCSATGSSLQQAKDAYANSCKLKRIDCDPTGDGNFKCASYAMGGSGANLVQTSSQSNPVTTSVSSGSGSSVRVEAETRSGSGWANRGDYIEFTGSNSYPSPTHGTLTYQIEIPTSGQWEMRWRAKAAKKTSGRNDLHNDAWAKMNGERVSGFHDVRTFRKVYSSGNGNWQVAATVEVGSHNFTKFRQQLDQGSYAFEISGRSNGYAIDYIEFVLVNGSTTSASASSASSNSSTSNASATSSNTYVDGDLLSLHWDSSMDPDDMQAMILTRELLDSYSPAVDYMAVNGTKKTRNAGILDGSTSHMRSMFPQGYEAWRNGLNSSVQKELYADTVDAFATAWALTLSAGHTVHVAEGGPANFTASVISELMSRGIDQSLLKRIRVVQHSWGWNEDNTDPSALNIVRQQATYIRIADGNYGNGHGSQHSATPDYALLNGNTAQRSSCSSFRSRAAKTEYAKQWETAFSRINNRCDGSDAVEVVWILGIETSRIPTLSAFADVYF